MVRSDRISERLSRAACESDDSAVVKLTFPPSMPKWFNPHGLKMQVVDFNLNKTKLQLGSTAAKLNLQVNYFLSNALYRFFAIERQLTFPKLSSASGITNIERSLAEAMFGISTVQPYYRKDDPRAHEWLKKYHLRATSVWPGVYIRYGRFLNIPGPGTGDDGDANLSIYINDSIKEAVEKLLKL
jgi:hypothetical protein